MDPVAAAVARAVLGGVHPAGDGGFLGPPVPSTHPDPHFIGPPVPVNPQLRVPGQPAPQEAAAPAHQPVPLGPGPQSDQSSAGPDLNPHFQERLGALMQAVKQAGGEIYPFSLARSVEDQQKLFADAVRKYGDEKIAAQYISPVGKSSHEVAAGVRAGLGPGAIAGDLRGDLAIATKLAPMFGLHFPDPKNPWHVTIAGV